MQQICKSYFAGPSELYNFKNNSPKINALAMAKILSYFTIILPAAFGLVYGVSLGIDYLKGRCSAKTTEEAAPVAALPQSPAQKNAVMFANQLHSSMNGTSIKAVRSIIGLLNLYAGGQIELTILKQQPFNQIIEVIKVNQNVDKTIQTLGAIKQWVDRLN